MTINMNPDHQPNTLTYRYPYVHETTIKYPEPKKKEPSEALVREVHLETHMANTVKELTDLLLSKHRDYGPKNISLAPGGAVNGLRVRMHDKLARINNLTDSGADPKHESLEDSFKDMANYAIIGLLVLRGQWDN